MKTPVTRSAEWNGELAARLKGYAADLGEDLTLPADMPVVEPPPVQAADLTVEPWVRRVAAELSLTILDDTRDGFAVLCPHCGGRRAMSPGSVKMWKHRGGVPLCSKKAHRSRCVRPEADAEHSG